MPIQFHCPACQAKISVPDKSAGQWGRCPRCSKKIIVPKAAPPAPANVAPPVLQPPVSLPSGSEAQNLGQQKPAPKHSASRTMPNLNFASLDIPDDSDGQKDLQVIVEPDLDEAGLPPLPDESQMAAAAAPPIVTRYKKNRFPHEIVWPVMLVLAIGFGAVFWLTDPLRLSVRGQLSAELVVAGDLVASVLPISEMANSEGDANAVLELVHRSPVNLASEIMASSIEASAKGLVMKVVPGTTMSLVRINVPPDSSLGRALAGRIAADDDARQRQLRKSVLELRDILIHFQQTKVQDTKKLLAIRDTLILASRVHGMGYVLEAKSRGASYPCLLEEKDSLVFAIPASIRKFELAGRSVNGVSSSTGRWEVTVAGETKLTSPEPEVIPWRPSGS